MRIAFVIYSLQAGGAERVLSIMANYWVQEGHEVTVFTLEDDRKPPFYDMDSRIRRVPLAIARPSKNTFSSVWNNLNRVYKLRGAIRGACPDTIITFMTETNVQVLLASFCLHVPVVVTEHTDPWSAPLVGAWTKLRNWLYPRAARVVVLNELAQSYFIRSPDIRVEVIPNPVFIAGTGTLDLPPEAGGKHLILAMGRLSQEKRFDLLVHAYSQVAERYPDWVLLILGEGPERSMLEALRKRLGLENQVMLPGAVRYPHALLKQGAIFVSSSELESFPMAMCEALACGLPVIAAEYNEGIRDIIDDGQNGILVPSGDLHALESAIMDLVQDRNKRDYLAARGVEISQRYGVEAVMRKWDHLLNDLTSSSQKAPL